MEVGKCMQANSKNLPYSILNTWFHIRPIHAQKVGTKQLEVRKTTPLWKPIDFYQRKHLH